MYVLRKGNDKLLTERQDTCLDYATASAYCVVNYSRSNSLIISALKLNI